MSFDVPKLVRNPGCDHGHDEESRNGRDINIDILEAYVWRPDPNGSSALCSGVIPGSVMLTPHSTSKDL